MIRVGLILLAFHLSTLASLAEESSVPTARSQGAVGDGQTDDTAAIQAAINLNQGGVRLARGVFRISQPIVIDLQSLGFSSVTGNGSATVVMTGPGPAFRFIGHHTGTADPHSVKDDVWNQERMPVIEGIEILGRHPEASGIELDGTMQATISKVAVREAHHGIHLVNRNRNVIISGCHLYDNTGVGVFLDRVNLHQFLIGDSHVSYNDGGGVVVLGGNVRNVHIGNCDLEANMPEADEPTSAANFLIDLRHDESVTTQDKWADTVAEITVTGCTIQHTGKNTHGANVRFIGRDDYPVNTAAISANVMSDAATNIDMEHVRGISLTGNVFFNAPTDVHIRSSDRVVLTGNVFDPREYEASRDEEGGLVISDSSDILLNASQFSEVTSPRPAIDLLRCERVSLTACVLRSCINGIRMVGCRDCLLTGNMITGTADGGVDIQLTECTGIQSVANLFSGGSKSPENTETPEQ